MAKHSVGGVWGVNMIKQVLSAVCVRGMAMSRVADRADETIKIIFFFSSRRRHTRSLCVHLLIRWKFEFYTIEITQYYYRSI